MVGQTTLACLDDVDKLKRHLKTLHERMCSGARPCDTSIGELFDNSRLESGGSFKGSNVFRVDSASEVGCEWRKKR